MNDEQIKALNADELVLMEKLNDILGWEEFEFSILTYTFTSIKFNGCANLGDLIQLEFLSIPMYELIAALREQPKSTVVDESNRHSVNFYEIRKAIDMFIASNWNP